MTGIYALGLGVGTKNKASNWLEVLFTQPVVNPSSELAAIFTSSLDKDAGTVEPSSETLKALGAALEAGGFAEQAALANKLSASQAPVCAVLLGADEGPKDVPEAYLKLQLLSHRLVKPHETKLDGVFGVLPNVAWTNKGAIDISEISDAQLEAKMNGECLTVECVDKFPKMTNYVVPTGVRIAHTARVRLGAYIGEGTTIMHEGFVNFNAGTLGTSMVEGRISAGVVVGEGSDLGGGSSTMGTLSGGGNIIISVGKECLVGANAGIGIPLGDRCTVESGLYNTAGTKVALLDDGNNLVEYTKARDLAGKSDLLFRRNSLSGVVECKTNKTAIALNEELHANN